mgnify:CR=1 FL=1
MDKRWDVLGFGAVAVDELVMVGRHPEPDSKNHVLAHRREGGGLTGTALVAVARLGLSLIHISEPTRLLSVSYAVFCLKKKTKTNKTYNNTARSPPA